MLNESLNPSVFTSLSYLSDLCDSVYHQGRQPVGEGLADVAECLTCLKSALFVKGPTVQGP